MPNQVIDERHRRWRLQADNGVVSHLSSRVVLTQGVSINRETVQVNLEGRHLRFTPPLVWHNQACYTLPSEILSQWRGVWSRTSRVVVQPEHCGSIMAKERLFEQMTDAIIAGQPGRARELADEAIGADIDPLEAIERGVKPGMDVVGECFAKGDLFIPDRKGWLN
jgi:hypothetical protein